jgi:hypothetical protein
VHIVNFGSNSNELINFAIKNKATEYRNATLGIWEDSLLSHVYFSAENEQIIQNGIRSVLYILFI